MISGVFGVSEHLEVYCSPSLRLKWSICRIFIVWFHTLPLLCHLAVTHSLRCAFYTFPNVFSSTSASENMSSAPGGAFTDVCKVCWLNFVITALIRVNVCYFMGEKNIVDVSVVWWFSEICCQVSHHTSLGREHLLIYKSPTHPARLAHVS